MFTLPDPFITSEIEYRRSRIAADFASARGGKPRRDRRRHHQPVSEQRHGAGSAA